MRPGRASAGLGHAFVAAVREEQSTDYSRPPVVLEGAHRGLAERNDAAGAKRTRVERVT
jgi:hypothetical protein